MSNLKEDSFEELSKLCKLGYDVQEEYENFENEEAGDTGRWSTEDYYDETKHYGYKRRRMLGSDTPERRRTIYELDSYAPSSGPSTSDVKFSHSEAELKPPRVQEIRYSASTGMPGIVRINLSPVTQKIVGCVIGENLTTEYPWLPVRKDVIEDNIDLHSESSDFLAIKNEIEAYPESKILVGYAPSVTEEGQFYVCLTEEGRDAILQHIHVKRQEHENRVRIARYKPLGIWSDLGSGPTVEENFVKSTRPLFEFEVIATGYALEIPASFENRDAEKQQNIFLEFHPNRHGFGNLTSRTLISRQIQSVPAQFEISAQSKATAFASSCCQYQSEHTSTSFENRKKLDLEALKVFIERHASSTVEEVVLNAMWDIYATDYIDSVRSERNTQTPTKAGTVIEHQSFHAQKITSKKVISAIWWHPDWYGFVFALYSRYSKNHYLTGPTNLNEVAEEDANSLNYVLVWSFKDCLKPTLLLTCPSEVTAVTTSPLNETVIVGGCANGQIVIWDIAGKVKEPRDPTIIETSAQVKYKEIMKNHAIWFRGVAESSSTVRPVAMSSLKHSQQGSITQITWMSSFYKIERTGKIVPLPSDATQEDLSCQFLTSSVDGSIAIWDLKFWPSEKELRGIRGMSRKKLRKFLSMKGSSSLLKILDRLLKPEYVLVVQYPNESRPVIITALSTYCSELPVQQSESSHTNDCATAKSSKFIDGKSNVQVEPKLLVGTIEGDFGCITWEGLGFGTDDAVSRETCQWLWIKKAHDGPITDLMRSRYYPPAVVTVGGKSFSIWHEDFGEPVFRRRSSVGYTGCSWSNIWPTVLILAQMDGTVEVWDLRVKSTEPILRSNLSGGIITGIYAHNLQVDMQCMGFCEFNGNFRLMFLTPEIFRKSDVVDVGWMKNFVNRHVERIRMFKTWQQNWTETTPVGMQKPDKSRKITTSTLNRKLSLKDVPSPVAQTADERWRSLELKRMQRVLLEKKGLQKDELETQYTPVLEMRRARKKKKLKAQQILKHQNEIFYENIAVLRPEQYRECNVSFFLPEKPPTSGTPKPADDPVPVDGGFQQGGQIKDDTARSPVLKGKFTEVDVLSRFLEVQELTLTNLANRPFDYSFDWQRVLKEGKTRRISMDVDLRKATRSHRKTHEI